jgi:hypothetical protein
MFQRPWYGKVAEIATGTGTGGGGGGTRIVGLVRGCVKSVVSGTSHGKDPIYTKVAYILGLRVCPTHRYVRAIIKNEACS